jgi:hypothetical protein
MNRFSVETDGENARGSAIAIADKLERLLEPHRRLHAFLHPTTWFEGFLFVFGWVPAALLVAALLAKDFDVALYSGMALFLLGAYIYAGKRLRPFVVFDSQASRRRGAVWNWFIFGVMTFLMFGTALVLFRRHLFGF